MPEPRLRINGGVIGGVDQIVTGRVNRESECKRARRIDGGLMIEGRVGGGYVTDGRPGNVLKTKQPESSSRETEVETRHCASGQQVSTWASWE